MKSDRNSLQIRKKELEKEVQTQLTFSPPHSWPVVA